MKAWILLPLRKKRRRVKRKSIFRHEYKRADLSSKLPQRIYLSIGLLRFNTRIGPTNFIIQIIYDILFIKMPSSGKFCRQNFRGFLVNGRAELFVETNF